MVLLGIGHVAFSLGNLLYVQSAKAGSRGSSWGVGEEMAIGSAERKRARVGKCILICGVKFRFSGVDETKDKMQVKILVRKRVR